MQLLEILAATLLLMTAVAQAQEAKPAREPSPPAVSAPAPPRDTAEAPARSGKPAAKTPASVDEDDDEAGKPSKKAPRRFNPTDKGSADDDIPFPADI